jgi:hypothetical protein
MEQIQEKTKVSIVLTDFVMGGMKFIFDPPYVCCGMKIENIYVIDDPRIGLTVMANNIFGLQKGAEFNFHTLWMKYVECDVNTLTIAGLRIRQRLLKMVRYVG